ncbi:TonB-dependent receptor [Emcibacter sp.]|uniref:TonB-dependent receptor n=1 Tax=Emcibacter sp. TaxID=1979954 RepID=UPI002AA76FE4|nr:TonB-dependent receptor [Emcibacter sp.]
MQSVKKMRKAKSLVAISALALSLSLSQGAWAQLSSTAHFYDINEASLSAALMEYSKQSNIVISVSPDLVDGKNARSLKGNYTTHQVMEILLSGHDLDYDILNNDTIVVRKKDTGHKPGAEKISYSDTGDFEKDLQVYGADERTDNYDTLEIEEIVATAASRLTSGFETAKPVTTVNREAMDNRGVSNVADYLNEIPSFSATSTPAANALSTASVGQNALNLRGLGPGRTLTLVDRRRFVAADQAGSVDVNLIPQMLIEQVEVVTGGASAQWGSDAVSGVVNMKLNRTLEGIKIDSRYGISERNDYEEIFGSIAFGTAFDDDRGHFVIAAEYQDNKGILHQNDRDWGRRQWGVVTNPLDTGPNDGIPGKMASENVLLGLGTPGGYLPLALGNHPAVSQIHFGPNGELLPYDVGDIPIPAAFALLPFQIGGDGGSLARTTSLASPLNRKSVMATLDYDISSNVTAYVDASYGRSHSTTDIVQPWSFIGGGPDVILADNPFIPADLQAIMAANSIPALIMARTNDDHGFIHGEPTAKTMRFVAGLKGNQEMFGSTWDWDLYGTFGQTKRRYIQTNSINKVNRNFAIDAVLDPGTGEIVCRANLGGANGAPGCVPLNLFGDGAPSQEALDYIHGVGQTDYKITQKVVAATVNGTLLDLPAGPVGMAFGMEYRDEGSDVSSNELFETGSAFLSNAEGLHGGFNVTEGFIELGAPILDTAGGVTLDIGGALRYADYSSSGGATTWSVNSVFSPVSGLKFRGSISSDLRAPNIGELFSPQMTGFGNVVNPDTGNSTLTRITRGGNPELTPETSRTYTLGAVIQPFEDRRFNLSVDWYRIHIEDAIGRVPAQTLVDNCVLDNIGCENVTIAPNGDVQEVQFTFLNIAERAVEGIDIEAQYILDNLWGGELGIRALATYIIESSNSFDGVTTVQDAGVVGRDYGSSLPKWRANATLDYNKDTWGATVQIRYVDGGDLYPDNTIEVIDYKVPSSTYVNLSARYTIVEQGESMVQLYGGINNLFDKDPSIAPSEFVSTWATNPILYDVIGRYFYAGVRASF